MTTNTPQDPSEAMIEAPAERSIANQAYAKEGPRKEDETHGAHVCRVALRAAQIAMQSARISTPSEDVAFAIATILAGRGVSSPEGSSLYDEVAYALAALKDNQPTDLPCGTTGPEDAESGCCPPCRARKDRETDREALADDISDILQNVLFPTLGPNRYDAAARAIVNMLASSASQRG